MTTAFPRFLLSSLLLLLGLLAPRLLRAQSADVRRQIDSLEVVLRAHPGADTVRVRTLVRLASRLNSATPAAAEQKAREALRLARQLNYPRGQASALLELAVCVYERGNLDSAEVLFASSAALWKARHLPQGQIRAQNGLASVYAIRGKYDQAMRLFVASLRVAEQLGDKKVQIRVLANLGSLAEQLRDDEQALRYYRRSLTLADSVQNAHEYETSLCNIAMLYINQRAYARAEPYVTRALALTRTSNDQQNRGTMLMAQGQIDMARRRLDVAAGYFQEALQIGRLVPDNFLIGRALLLLGEVTTKQKQPALALSYFQQALPLLRETGVNEYLRDAYQGQAAAYAALGQPAQAYASQRQQISFNDSVVAEKRSSETRLLQTRFETERQRAENRVQAARLRTQQQIIRRRNTQLIGGLVVAALLAGLGYLLYNRRRLRQQVELEQARVAFEQERQLLERQRAAAVLEAEENERRRIGSDLHDGIGQLLSAAKLNLHALQQQLGPRLDGHETLLDNALSVVDESFREVRGISHNLMPNALIKRGLAAAVRDFLDKLPSDNGLRVEVQAYGIDATRLPPHTENVLFRVIQELVQNIIKHAQASEVAIQLVQGADDLTVTVEDNGRGFDPEALGPDAGIGLRNVQTRMAYLGGQADFDTAPGRGTTVTLEVPLAVPAVPAG